VLYAATLAARFDEKLTEIQPVLAEIANLLKD
jgi:hypothetical protein